jgi:hypothetical protein
MGHVTILGWLVHAASGGAGWWIFSSFVQSMPVPQANERWYGWLYLFMQRLGANHQLANAVQNGPAKQG